MNNIQIPACCVQNTVFRSTVTNMVIMRNLEVVSDTFVK
jgi:hypothetical protein